MKYFIYFVCFIISNISNGSCQTMLPKDFVYLQQIAPDIKQEINIEKLILKNKIYIFNTDLYRFFEKKDFDLYQKAELKSK